MTITPTATTPAILPAGATDAGAASDAAVSGDFLALVQQALAGVVGGAPAPAVAAGQPGATPGGSAEAGPNATPDPDPVLADPALAAASGLTALAAPALPLPVVASADPAGTGTGAVDAPSNVGSTAVLDASTPAGTSEPRPSAGHEPRQPVAAEDGGATSGAVQAAALDGSVGTADAGGAGDTAADSGTGQQPAPAAPAASPVATVVPASAPAAPATLQPTGTQATAQVTGQVFPEVTSLVTRGDGTHRITLTLKPEALGEVRVVMTVRDGAVHVRLAAGHEAQQAILDGSNELTRLLERAGATDTRIVVRDLIAGPAPATGSASDSGPDLGQGQAAGQGLDAGSNRPQDQHAGTRAEHTATDGTHDTTTAGTNPSRPVQSVTHARTSGVDVTM